MVNSQEKLRLKIYQRFADVSRRRIIRMLIDGRQCNVGFFTDITRGKEAEERASKEKKSCEALIQRSRYIAGIGGVR